MVLLQWFNQDKGYMAVVSICYKMHYREQTHRIHVELGQEKGRCMHCTINQDISGGLFPVSNHIGRREHVSCNFRGLSMKANTRGGIDVSPRVTHGRDSIPTNIVGEAYVESSIHKGESDLRLISENTSGGVERCSVPLGSDSSVPLGSDSSSKQEQLKTLDSYFDKLKNDASQPPLISFKSNTDLLNRSRESSKDKRFRSLGDSPGMLIAKGELRPADDYFANVNKDVNLKGQVDETTEARNILKIQNSYMESQRRIDQAELQILDDETSNLYLIGITSSINIAVFLFEIASPIRNSELELYSLPSLYGAKINHLILEGEWWRLVTPMFLHSGILHIGLSCWVLLTFGPQVCRAYGPFTFFLIYMLGGISGNLTSFLHTSDSTVGGTGPVFAIIGAWLIYQYQNRDAMGNDVSESMFQKAILATAFGFILSTSGPVDDWMHLGAAFAGIAYGFLTCSTLQTDNASSETGQDERITFVRRNVNPCKSLLFFSLFILALGSLLFVVEPPLS